MFPDFMISVRIVSARFGPFHCKKEHQKFLPLNLSSWHNPHTGPLSKRLLLLLCIGLGLKKPQSPELQGHCNYKWHAKGSTALSHHYSLHTLLLWNHPCAGHLSRSKRLLLLLHLGIRLCLGLREPQSPELQALTLKETC